MSKSKKSKQNQSVLCETVHVHVHVDSVVSRARPWTQTVILDAQNSSECVNLDAQIMILDAQKKGGVQKTPTFEILDTTL